MPTQRPLRRPSILRRLASMFYESLLLLAVLAVLLILPRVLLGAFAHVIAAQIILQAHCFIVLLIYFLWFWSKGGQRLGMKTWRIRVVSRDVQTVRPTLPFLRTPGQFAVSYESMLELMDPPDRSVFTAAIQSGLQEGKSFGFEQGILRPDGTKRTIHQRGDTVRDESGRTVKIFGTAQDVTERKQAEDELERMHLELLDTARQAGMAEVATGVLHNVGNVLNSVNVSANCISDTVGKSKAANLSKVVAMLDAHIRPRTIFNR